MLIHTIKYDKSTIDVADWLYYFKYNFQKIDEYLILNEHGVSISNNNNEICFNGKLVDCKMWYRRGDLIFNKTKQLFTNSPQYQAFIEMDYKFIKQTYNDIIPYLLNRPNQNNINKLLIYNIAKSLKIVFPKSFITSNIENLRCLNSEDNVLIAKTISWPSVKVEYFNRKISLGGGNVIIDLNIFNSKLKFYPSLFQQYIPKKYEIRSFYLKGQFRSMAIFSQQNEKTRTDFRNYDYERPNRTVPYNLPKSLENKLHKLMLKLDINCGSMDIIVTPDDQYYFLEVNPIGQFQWLSKGCNYFIERMIAKNLSGDETWSN